MKILELWKQPPPHEVIVVETNKALKKVLHHPLIPTFVTNQLEPFLKKIMVLDDKAYVDLGVRCNASINTGSVYAQKRLAEIRNLIEHSTAVFIPHHPDTKKPVIMVRQSYLQKHDYALDTWPGLLSEELAHALYKRQTVPFSAIPEVPVIKEEDQNFYFSIRGSCADGFALLKQKFAKRGIKVKNSEEIEVTFSGFKFVYRHIPTGEEMILEEYTEETRSAIIQTIFEALRLGMQTNPTGTPDSQFAAGQQALLRLQYTRAQAAFAFLSVYLKKYPLSRDTFVTLFRSLYEKNAQEFYDSLETYDLKAAFVTAFNMVALVQLGRDNRPR